MTESTPTPQEARMLYLLITGKSNRQIAAYLGQTHQHVKNKMHEMARRYGASNRTQLAVMAWEAMTG